MTRKSKDLCYESCLTNFASILTVGPHAQSTLDQAVLSWLQASKVHVEALFQALVELSEGEFELRRDHAIYERMGCLCSLFRYAVVHLLQCCDTLTVTAAGRSGGSGSSSLPFLESVSRVAQDLEEWAIQSIGEFVDVFVLTPFAHSY